MSFGSLTAIPFRSVVESRSARSDHSDEGFEESDPGETGNVVAKMVSRFIDRVCIEGGVTTEHVRNLHVMVPGVVHMHIETLDAIHRESKRIPPVQKPKIQVPSLLLGEEIQGEPMRVYLLADGREDGGATSTLMPAEGALFLTNYRVVFRGSPCDPLSCEQNVVRTFPISSLTKEKRVSVLYLPHLDQVMQEGLQLRSSTFQLIKVAFDEEVTAESIESFRKLLTRARHPANEFGYFAFASHGIIAHTPAHKIKEKNATLKGFAKKTLLRTAKRAGFKQKSVSRRKYVLSGVDFDENGSLNEQNVGNANNQLDHNDDDDSDENVETMPRVTVKDVERLKERSYVRDWKRLGFGEQHSGYRIASVNCNYSLCRTYPGKFEETQCIEHSILLIASLSISSNNCCAARHNGRFVALPRALLQKPTHSARHLATSAQRCHSAAWLRATCQGRNGNIEGEPRWLNKCIHRLDWLP